MVDFGRELVFRQLRRSTGPANSRLRWIGWRGLTVQVGAVLRTSVEDNGIMG
jgi:hypothetical protein